MHHKWQSVPACHRFKALFRWFYLNFTEPLSKTCLFSRTSRKPYLTQKSSITKNFELNNINYSSFSKCDGALGKPKRTMRQLHKFTFALCHPPHPRYWGNRNPYPLHTSAQYLRLFRFRGSYCPQASLPIALL